MAAVAALALFLSGSGRSAASGQETLWITFTGTGSGTGQHFTGSGGTGTIVASWAIGWKLRVDVSYGQIQCTQLPSCAAVPYAFTAKGTGTVTGSSDPQKNCSKPIRPVPVQNGPQLQGSFDSKRVSLGTLSPVGAGIEVVTPGQCNVFGGQFTFADPTKARAQAVFPQSLVVGHPGQPLSKPVVGRGPGHPCCLPGPVWVEWSGRFTIQLGGSRPKLRPPRPPAKPYGPGRPGSTPPPPTTPTKAPLARRG